MKRLRLLIGIAMATLLAAGCQGPAADFTPTPKLNVLYPDALTWGAAGNGEKIILISGENIVEATITLSELANFTATMENSAITISPKGANTSYQDIVETLTVNVLGGNSLTATITQKAKPVPELTSLTPDALIWTADNTEAKVITIAGNNIEGNAITLSELQNFNASIEGNKITVSPKAANETTENFEETLTVTVTDGNSLTATLTQNNPDVVLVPELTTLSPESLTWTAESTEAQTITIAGNYLEDAVITVSGADAFTAAVDGTTITVTPNGANTTEEDIVNQLTISVEGGNSLTATLTQTKPAPKAELTSLTPASLSWTAAEKDARTITVAGNNLEGAVITVSAPENFTATVDGTTITITPKAANTGDADIVNQLAVSVEGGNSLTATLTQTKPEPVVPVDSPWVKVNENLADWSGTYLVAIIEFEPDNPRGWTQAFANSNRFFLTTADNNNVITAARTTKDGESMPMEDLLTKYSITIAKTSDGYSIRLADGKYMTRTATGPGIDVSDTEVTGATEIEFDPADNTVRFHLSTVGVGFGFNPVNGNNRFNYFPDDKWSDKKRISLYKYVVNN